MGNMLAFEMEKQQYLKYFAFQNDAVAICNYGLRSPACSSA